MSTTKNLAIESLLGPMTKISNEVNAFREKIREMVLAGLGNLKLGDKIYLQEAYASCILISEFTIEKVEVQSTVSTLGVDRINALNAIDWLVKDLNSANSEPKIKWKLLLSGRCKSWELSREFKSHSLKPNGDINNPEETWREPFRVALDEETGVTTILDDPGPWGCERKILTKDEFRNWLKKFKNGSNKNTASN